MVALVVYSHNALATDQGIHKGETITTGADHAQRSTAQASPTESGS
jgi:hypothetical protein